MRRVLHVLAAASLAASASFATEPKSDLSLELRIVDTVMSKGALGKPARGIARIEVALDAFRDAQEVELRIERPGGTPLTLRPDWKDARGRELAPGARGITISARGRIVTRFEVSLEGAAMHPVLVRATARLGAEEVSTEGFVFVPIGVTKTVVEEDLEAGLANFPVKEAN
jgi:hypothetical protein